MPQAPTIACLLTPPGKGGIAVICLRGARTHEILARLFRPLGSHAEGGAGRLQLGRLVADGRVLDEAVVQSQGDWAEINIHGGPAVARGVLEAVLHCGATIVPSPTSADGSADSRVAHPAPPSSGLPTAHPRWDNPAIGEELLEILPCCASATVVSALSRQWSAGLSELARDVLHDLGPDVGRATGSAAPRACCTRNAWADLLRQAANGVSAMRRILEPAEVVLAGPPNAGKSTLANALVGRPISLVHQTPGTTRNWVRELALVNGLPVWITDTAGLWCGEALSRGEGILRGEGSLPVRVSPLRPEGILRGEGILPLRPEGILPSAVSSSSSSAASSSAGRQAPPVPESALRSEIDRRSSDHALERIARADLVLILGQPPAASPHAAGGRAKVIRIWTKTDACPPPAGEAGDGPYRCVSARTGEGMEQLKGDVLRALGLADFDPAIPRAFTARQATLLLAAAESLDHKDAAQAASSLRKLLQGATQP